MPGFPPQALDWQSGSPWSRLGQLSSVNFGNLQKSISLFLSALDLSCRDLQEPIKIFIAAIFLASLRPFELKWWAI